MGATWIFIIGVIIIAVILAAVSKDGTLIALIIYGAIAVIAVVGVYEGVCWLVEHINIAVRLGG